MSYNLTLFHLIIIVFTRAQLHAEPRDGKQKTLESDEIEVKSESCFLCLICITKFHWLSQIRFTVFRLLSVPHHTLQWIDISFLKFIQKNTLIFILFNQVKKCGKKWERSWNFREKFYTQINNFYHFTQIVCDFIPVLCCEICVKGFDLFDFKFQLYEWK